MKAILLLLPLALAASLARAQTAPTITLADMPAVGDTLRLSQAAPALPSGGPALALAGANQTWNYARLAPVAQRVDRYNNVNTTTLYQQLTFGLAGPNRASVVAPRALPAAAGTALPVTDPLEFFYGSASDFRSVGFGATVGGTGLPVTYDSQAKQDVIYRFPLTYGSASDVSNSYFQVAVPGSGAVSQKRRRTNVVDGWGTLTTPFGTFQTVRVVSSLLDHDSLVVGTSPAQIADIPLQRQYKWLANGVHVPVLTITTAVVAGQETIATIEYRDVYRRITALAARSAALEAGLSLYPNPSAVGTALRLALPAGSGPVAVAATDLLGRALFHRSYPSGADVVLEAAAFGTFRGVLLLTVQTAQGTAARRVVRQ